MGKSSGKKKIPIVSVDKKNTYKISEKKAFRIKIKAIPRWYNSISKIQYKLVRAKKKSSQYRWKNGTGVKIKAGFKGRLYIRYKTTVGNVIVKTKGFTVKGKK